MDIRRIGLFAVFIFVTNALWNAWQTDYPPKKTDQPTEAVRLTNASPIRLPSSSTVSSSESVTPLPNQNQTVVKPVEDTVGQFIQVKTDVFNLSINLKQGDVVFAQLNQYPVSVNEKNIPFTLLNNQTAGRYVANSELLTQQSGAASPLVLNYTSSQSTYTLSPNKPVLKVTLTGKTTEGLVVDKVFTFKQGSYLVDVQYQLKNEGQMTIPLYMNTQLLRHLPEEDKSSIFHVGSYTGASYAKLPEEKYQKVNFKDMTKSNLEVDVTGGWIAMQQHYFLTAWIPDAQNKNLFYTREDNGNYIIGAVSLPISLAPNASHTWRSGLYLGPEDTDVLKAISPGLDLTVDYGWLWFLSSLLFSLMKTIHQFTGNWGWSIVLVTLLVKLAFYRLSASSYKSMAGMRQLQPKIQALKERFGEDKAKFSQATMELYRQEKVNPLGGCLPIVIQIPVFIALYWVLLESVELRQAPFIFWINDLAAADPYHVLPIIMGGTMLIQQRLNPTPPDPMQAKVMMFLPVLFTGLFWSFPSGLVLYWIVNNTLSILQQWRITKKYETESTKPYSKTPFVKAK